MGIVASLDDRRNLGGCPFMSVGQFKEQTGLRSGGHEENIFLPNPECGEKEASRDKARRAKGTECPT